MMKIPNVREIIHTLIRITPMTQKVIDRTTGPAAHEDYEGHSAAGVQGRFPRNKAGSRDALENAHADVLTNYGITKAKLNKLRGDTDLVEKALYEALNLYGSDGCNEEEFMEYRVRPSEPIPSLAHLTLAAISVIQRAPLSEKELAHTRRELKNSQNKVERQKREITTALTAIKAQGAILGGITIEEEAGS